MDASEMFIFEGKENRKLEKKTEEAQNEAYEQNSTYTGTEPWNIDHIPERRLSKKEEEERRRALGKTCVWHPWRPAYSICAYCGRPFCYEDIVEQNGRFYCLEDIDKVMVYKPEPVKIPISLKTAFVSAIFFMMPLLVFIYFEVDNLFSSISYLLNVGIIAFIRNFIFLYPSTLPLIGGILCIFGIISGIAILVNDRRYYAIGIIFGGIMTLFFAFQFGVRPFLYNFGIMILSLIAFILIIVSKTTVEHTHTETPVEDAGRFNLPEGVQNIGRF